LGDVKPLTLISTPPPLVSQNDGATLTLSSVSSQRVAAVLAEHGVPVCGLKPWFVPGPAIPVHGWAACWGVTVRLRWTCAVAAGTKTSAAATARELAVAATRMTRTFVASRSTGRADSSPPAR
jgi:hypothetical protein